MGQSSGEIIALASVFTFLAIVAVALRTWARKKTKQPLAADDYLSYAAVVVMCGVLTTPLIIICALDNFGNHIKTTPTGEPLPPSHRYNVCQLVLEVCGYVPIALAKCSILMFYKRIFRGAMLAAAVWTLMGLTIAWCTTFFFGTLFECTPIDKSLSLPPGSPGVKCIDMVKLFYAGASTDVILDFAILLVPLQPVLKLQMPPRQKFGVLLVFLTGALAIAASITRLVEFVYAGRQLRAGNPDTTYFVAPTVYWTMIEAALCIIAVCLPSLRPIFRGVSTENLLNSLRSALSLHSNSRPSTYRDPSFDEQIRKESGASEFAMLEQPYQGTNQYETTAFKGPEKVEGKDDMPDRGILVETTISRNA
ncbi:hypothetical protein PRZ48_005853 [Zasmidium cellare]|uniref:Rhodopsin domain-containing protein n=1 Tax=Zasmidium cellare TaxID=395010 RepID=A0ABR0EMJ1_ZASCE|nr:hypothetical protein PRZ48_005853 [Zasmidium cellare]